MRLGQILLLLFSIFFEFNCEQGILRGRVNCSIGETMPCSCPSGSQGVKACAEHGVKWLECHCDDNTPTSSPTADANGQSATEQSVFTDGGQASDQTVSFPSDLMGADAHGWKLPAEMIKICPVGDSLTQASPGWRGPLLEKLKNAGYNVDFVGPKSDEIGSGHAGFGGFIIGPAKNKYLDQYVGEGKGNIYAQIDSIISTQPDLLLLDIGINEYYNVDESNYDVAKESPPRLTQLVDTFFEKNPELAIFIATIGWPGGAGEEINAAIPTIVKEQTAKGRHIFLVDMRNEAALTQSETSDGLHPTGDGWVKMSDVWFKHLDPLLKDVQAK